MAPLRKHIAQLIGIVHGTIHRLKGLGSDTEIGDFGTNVDDSVEPELFSLPKQLHLMRMLMHVHIHSPRVGVPRQCPLIVQRAQQLHAHADPEGCPSKTRGPGRPAAFTNQCP